MPLLLAEWDALKKVVIGMVHLRALPGSPKYDGSFKRVLETAQRDAEALAEGGVHGVMVENFGDVPFYPGRVPRHVVASMTAIALRVRERIGELPLGINVLRNDGLSALAVASACGASFIRVNVLCGARVADQGILQGIAHELLRERASLRSKHIKILADVDVKHSAPLAKRDIEDEVSDTIQRGCADAIIVSGAGTGRATDLEKVQNVRRAARPTAVFIGSGVTSETVEGALSVSDGVIVGSSLKRFGHAEDEVDVARVRDLMVKVKALA